MIDKQNPAYEIVYHPIRKRPFARKGEPDFLPGNTDFTTWETEVPVVLKIKARKVDNWKMDGGNAGDVPLHSVTSDKEYTIVELIPYGCTGFAFQSFHY